MQTKYDPSYYAAATSLEYASVARRGFAYFIDVIVLGIFQNFIIIGINAMGLHASANATTTQGDAAHMFAYWLRHLDTYGILQIAILTILPIVYFIIIEAVQGATVGKLVLGIRVARLDGSPIGWGQSIIRNVLRIIDHIPYGIPYLVGAILIWTSPRYQRLGDRAADTVVIRSRR